MNIFSPQTGGHRLYLDDFTIMQNAYADSIKGILSGLYPGGTFIVSGMKYSKTGPTITITQGYFGLNGEVISFAGSSITFQPSPARLFIKVLQTPITPPDPVVYKDTIAKNVHFSRVGTLKYFNVSDGDVDGVNGAYYDNISPGAIFQLGMVIEWWPSYPGEENDVFDDTGLGIGRMRGWGICNGINVTPDLRGCFTVQPSLGMRNSSALVSGAIDGVNISTQVGAKEKAILQSNLPLYNLPVTDGGHSHLPGTLPARGDRKNGDDSGGNQMWQMNASDPTTGGHGFPVNDGEEDRGITATQWTASTATGISVSSGGSGVLFNVVPPAYAMIKIARLI